MQRFWMVVKKHRFYIWVPALIVMFIVGMVVGHRQWNHDFSGFPPLYERNSRDIVYVHLSNPPSNLFHFSDCKYFSARMRAMGSADAVYVKGTFKPCPKCSIVTADNNGTFRFWGWRHGGGKDAPTRIAETP